MLAYCFRTHSFIHQTATFMLPPFSHCTWGMVAGGVECWWGMKKKDELALNQLLKEVIDCGRGKMCTRESLFCPLAKSFSHCLIFSCLFIYLSLWKAITLLGQG